MRQETVDSRPKTGDRRQEREVSTKDAIQKKSIVHFFFITDFPHTNMRYVPIGNQLFTFYHLCVLLYNDSGYGDDGALHHRNCLKALLIVHVYYTLFICTAPCPISFAQHCTKL